MNTPANVTINYLRTELKIAEECNDTQEYVDALKLVIQVLEDCNPD